MFSSPPLFVRICLNISICFVVPQNSLIIKKTPLGFLTFLQYTWNILTFISSIYRHILEGWYASSLAALDFWQI